MDYGQYCYLLKSTVSKRYYIGYSVDPSRRLRQHNGEIEGGAKKTHKGRPWVIICIISGFPDSHTALRFEWRWQKQRQKGVRQPLVRLQNVINRGDHFQTLWPPLSVLWHEPGHQVVGGRVNNYLLCG